MEIGKRLRKIKNKILVMSGKGGVGKAVWRPIFPSALQKRGTGSG
jgi:Mrp family chromosome partitioning ATPase